jgi:hypothetical protein
MQDEAAQALIVDMREAFERREWTEALTSYEQLRPLLKGRRSVRIEATCLAARALTAQKDRSRARALLKPLAEGEYTRAIHCDALAHAFLDLRNYREAARMCEAAETLHEAEKTKKKKKAA